MKGTYFFNMTLKNIDVNENGMFLTKTIYNKLRDARGFCKEFFKMEACDKFKIQSKLNALNYKAQKVFFMTLSSYKKGKF